MDPVVFNFSGPTKLNNFLHSFAHCTFQHGCHNLPFTDDTAAMVDTGHDGLADQWLESILIIGFVPFALLCLYLLIDCLIRCVRHCCCRAKYPASSSSGGCCSWCCPVEVDELEDSFLVPSSRIAFGSRSYGSTFPAAEVGPHADAPVLTPSSPVSHNPKRGGTAGDFGSPSGSLYQSGISSSSNPAHDPSNPFHTSSRLISVAAHLDGDDDHRPAAIARRGHPDRNYDTRMLVAVIFSVIAITLLSVSIAFSQKYDSSWQDIRGEVLETHDYFQISLNEGGVGAMVNDCSNLQQMLLTLLQAGISSPQPISVKLQTDIRGLASNYGLLSSSELSIFSSQLSNQTSHLQDAKDFMDDTEKIRQDATYSILALSLLATLLFIMVHIYYKQRQTLALVSTCLFAFLLVAVSWLWAVGLTTSVGLSDVCQAPLDYGNSFLNSSEVQTWNSDHPMNSADVQLFQFYFNCPQNADNSSTVPENPLYKQYVSVINYALDSSILTGELNQIVNYIQTNRSQDLGQYATYLVALNATLYSDLNFVTSQLGCETVHTWLMNGVDHVCRPITESLFVATTLQFIAVLFLLFVRCLVWMRQKRRTEFDDEDEAHVARPPPPEPRFGTGSANFSSHGSGSNRYMTV